MEEKEREREVEERRILLWSTYKDTGQTKHTCLLCMYNVDKMLHIHYVMSKQSRPHTRTRTGNIFSKFFPRRRQVLTVATPTAVELHEPASPSSCYGGGEVVALETDHAHRGVVVEGTGGSVCGGRSNARVENSCHHQQTIHSFHTFVREPHETLGAEIHCKVVRHAPQKYNNDGI